MKNYLPKEVLKELQTLTGRDIPDPNTDDYDAMIDQLKASKNPQHHRAAMLMESKVKTTGKDPREKLEQREKWAGKLRGLRRGLILTYDGMESGWVFSRGKLIGWVALACALGLGWMFSSLAKPIVPSTADAPASLTGGALASGSGGGADTTGGATVTEAAASAQSTRVSSVEAENAGDPFAGFAGEPLSSHLAGSPTLPVGSNAAVGAGVPATDPAQTGGPYDPSAAGEPSPARFRVASLDAAPGRQNARLNTDAATTPARRAALSSDAAPARKVGSGLHVSPAAPRRGAVFAGEARPGAAPLDVSPAPAVQPQGGSPSPSAPLGEPSGGAAGEGENVRFMHVFQSAGGEWGAPPSGGSDFIDNAGNPYDPATVTPEPAPVSAPDYAVGDSVKATLEVGPVLVEGEEGGQSGAGSNQVIARDENGTAWVGEAVLQRSGRITIRFSAAINGDGERQVEAIALDNDSFAGLPASYRETSPALASNLARGALRGVTDYVDDLRGGGSVAFRGQNAIVTDNVAPIETSILGSVAELFTPPSTDQQALIRVVTIEPNTEFILKVLR